LLTVPSCEPPSSASRAKLRGVGSAAKVGVGLATTLAEGATEGELVAAAMVGVAVRAVGPCGTEHAESSRTKTSARKAF
jgi:hypothetical protein